MGVPSCSSPSDTTQKTCSNIKGLSFTCFAGDWGAESKNPHIMSHQIRMAQRWLCIALHNYRPCIKSQGRQGRRRIRILCDRCYLCFESIIDTATQIWFHVFNLPDQHFDVLNCLCEPLTLVLCCLVLCCEQERATGKDHVFYSTSTYMRLSSEHQRVFYGL